MFVSVDPPFRARACRSLSPFRDRFAWVPACSAGRVAERCGGRSLPKPVQTISRQKPSASYASQESNEIYTNLYRFSYFRRYNRRNSVRKRRFSHRGYTTHWRDYRSTWHARCADCGALLPDFRQHLEGRTSRALCCGPGWLVSP